MTAWSLTATCWSWRRSCSSWGPACAVARRNLIMILIGVEVMLNAAGLALVGRLPALAAVWTARPWSSSSWRGRGRSGGGPGPHRLFPAAHRHGGCRPLRSHEGLTWKPSFCFSLLLPLGGVRHQRPPWAVCCPGGRWRGWPAPRSWGPWSGRGGPGPGRRPGP